MSESKEKKIRRGINRETRKQAKGVMGKTAKAVIRRIARQRDIITIIALCECAVIVILSLWILWG